MPAVLGRVTAAADAPRGPDAKYRIQVPPEWLNAGATLEVTLPRNLECARCDGGGCDVCGGSGALTLRGRKELPELIQITLPEGAPESGGRGVTLRIPESGGLPEEGSDLPRGQLLLTVRPDAEASATVRLWTDEEVPEEPEAAPEAAAQAGRWGLPAFAAILLIVLLTFVVARMYGCG